jgi:hypothetical protein
MGSDLYAQRISQGGIVQWPANGVPICAAAGAAQGTVLVSDGAGGAIAAWYDSRAGSSYNYDIYAQRVDRWGCLGAQATITSIVDAPADEGGWVTLAFNASPEDGGGHGYVNEYRVWRQIPQLAAQAALARGARLASREEAAASDSPDLVLATPSGAQTYYWESVGTFPATGAPSYPGISVTTRCDSVAGSNPLTLFMVEARWSTGGWWWFSDPASGYSVDNLAPSAPSPFTGSYSAGTATLSWGASGAADFALFRLYRGKNTTFATGPGNLVRTQAGTGYVDVAGEPCIYKLTAVDIHGNESVAATLQPSGTADVAAATPRELALSAPAPNPLHGSCTMRLSLPREAAVTLAVFDQQGRRVHTLLAGALPAGEHPVVWGGCDDSGRSVASGIYFARLECEGRTLTRRIAVVR